MNRYSEVASRYATALFDMTSDADSQNKVFSDVRAINKIFAEDQEVGDFMVSPLVQPSDRVKVLEEALKNSDVSDDVKKFVLVLATKNRLGLFNDIVAAFQDKADEANGVTRGTVRSAYALSSDERSKIEEIVKKATGKNVILTYTEDPSVIGGLIAQVGSYTFDDSIDSHLRRMKEELNRRAH